MELPMFSASSAVIERNSKIKGVSAEGPIHQSMNLTMIVNPIVAAVTARKGLAFTESMNPKDNLVVVTIR